MCLFLNWQKTEYILYNTNGTIDISALHFQSSDTLTYFGMIFDKNITFNKQGDTVVKSSFYYLHLLAKKEP